MSRIILFDRFVNANGSIRFHERFESFTELTNLLIKFLRVNRLVMEIDLVTSISTV